MTSAFIFQELFILLLSAPTDTLFSALFLSVRRRPATKRLKLCSKWSQKLGEAGEASDWQPMKPTVTPDSYKWLPAYLTLGRQWSAVKWRLIAFLNFACFRPCHFVYILNHESVVNKTVSEGLLIRIGFSSACSEGWLLHKSKSTYTTYSVVHQELGLG